jgi:hypothetical protein
METMDQRRLRNVMAVFICFLAAAIMVGISDMYSRNKASKGPARVFIVRRVYDTSYVARPVTIVLNNKDYEVSLAPVRYTEEKFTELTDNGDIAKAKRQEQHDRTRGR